MSSLPKIGMNKGFKFNLLIDGSICELIKILFAQRIAPTRLVSATQDCIFAPFILGS